MKSALLMCTLILLLTACQKEPDFIENSVIPSTPVNPGPAVGCKPLKAYLYDDYSGTTIEDSASYEYTGNQLTRIWLNTDKFFSFEYSNGRVAKRIYGDRATNLPFTYWTFHYNTDGSLASWQERLDPITVPDLSDSAHFTYSSGKVSKLSIYSYEPVTAALQIETEYEYSYTGGNITTQVRKDYNNGTLYSTQVFTLGYDQKPNYRRQQQPQFLLTDAFQITLEPYYYAWALSENNVVSEKYEPALPPLVWSYVLDAKANLTDVKVAGNNFIKYTYKCP